jgi:hypothetical protein
LFLFSTKYSYTLYNQNHHLSTETSKVANSHHGSWK